VSSRIQMVACTAAIAASLFVSGAEAQRRGAGQSDANQPVAVSLKVGADTYESSGGGRCTYAPAASIYQTPAELWTVQQSGNKQSLTVSLWKPKDGSGDMLTMSVSTGNVSQQINTVRGGGPTSGSASVALQKAGSGGTFTIQAKTKDGAAITGTIRCSTFAEHIAEGG
jgi:hypothetical protein